MSEAIEARVAVLEQIALSTEQALKELRADIRQLGDRQDRYFQALLTRQDRQFLWLLSIMLGSWATLLGVMAHGFHWI